MSEQTALHLSKQPYISANSPISLVTVHGIKDPFIPSVEANEINKFM